MNLIFKNTPLDVVIQIVEYSGIMKYRNGKFMNQLLKNDERYNVLIQKLSLFKPVFLALATPIFHQ